MTNLAQQLTKLDTFDAAEWVGVTFRRPKGAPSIEFQSVEILSDVIAKLEYAPDLRDPRALGVLWGMAHRQGLRVESSTGVGSEDAAMHIAYSLVEASK